MNDNRPTIDRQRSAQNPLHWTVDYGQGPRPVTLPHAWKQDVPVAWEGPALYQTTLPPITEKSWLVIHGASYQAEISLDNQPLQTHQGIWDAFSIPLDPNPAPQTLAIKVTKNGGSTFPVKEVLSGFLPFVFQTFGGLFRPVELIPGPLDPLIPKPVPPTRVQLQGSKIYVDQKPFYMRGALTWGWYPELGHPHPDLETCRQECRLAKELGFNLFKFCLWLPPHHFFQALEEHDLEAWVELPLWDPTDDPAKLEAIKQEIKRIVTQYRHHDRIIAWTVGCELHASTPHDFRRELVEFVQAETGCPLVKDNSGGAEMYGGDLREYGTFDDFHPYCDTPFYRPVLESLRLGPRNPKPILLGEFNDYDHARDLLAQKAQNPYYLSDNDDLNHQGVRWQHDFPNLLHGDPPLPEADYQAWIRYSISKGHFIRKKVHESVRQNPDIAGYAITGWRDTPISTSGMVDDDLNPRYGPQHVKSWNQPFHLGLLPDRCPPWVNGGNRPGWRDPQNHFVGDAHIKITAHAESGFIGTLQWRIEGGPSDRQSIHLEPLEPTVVAEVNAHLTPGKHLLVAELVNPQGQVVHHDSWPIWAHEKVTEAPGWQIHDPKELLKIPTDPQGQNLLFTLPEVKVLPGLKHLPAEMQADMKVLAFVEGSVKAPAWRECFFDYADPARLAVANQWEQLFSLTGDTFLDPQTDLSEFDQVTPLMTRIDTRTYEKSIVIAQVQIGTIQGLVTTLRPWGGLGAQPPDFARNPAGHNFLKNLLDYANETGNSA